MSNEKPSSFPTSPMSPNKQYFPKFLPFHNVRMCITFIFRIYGKNFKNLCFFCRLILQNSMNFVQNCRAESVFRANQSPRLLCVSTFLKRCSNIMDAAATLKSEMISKSLLILAIILFSTSSAKEKNYVEIPEPALLNGTSYVISSFSPKIFVRSADFSLNSTQCIHYSFKMLERRVR